MRVLAIGSLVTVGAVVASVPSPGTVDAAGMIGPSGRLCFSVAGSPGDAAIVNLTPVQAQGGGSGQLVSSSVSNPPVASNVNYRVGSVDPNVAVARIGSDGKVCFVNSSHTSVHLVADHLATIYASAYTSATSSGAPDRKVDTRKGLGGTLIGPSGRLCFSVSGSPGDAAIVNLTPVQAAGSGNGQLVSSNVSNPPVASNVNFGPGTVDPNVAVARIGDDGKVCFVNSKHTSVHLVADHLGTVAGSAYTPATSSGAPDRRVDTRKGIGGTMIGPSGRRCFSVAGSPGDAAIVNLTPVQAGGNGNGQLVSSSVSNPPVASNVNYRVGSVDPNVAVTPIGADGKVCFVNSNSANVHLIADHLGSIAGSAYASATSSGAPDRKVDTRPPAPVPVKSFAPGQYLVGSQVPAGRYEMNATSGCYWERQSGLGGSFNDIIANDFLSFTGRVIVDILSSDLAFEFDGDCGVLSTYAGSNARLASISGGSHVVGEHIVAGTYRSVVASGCYWARLSNFSGGLGGIIANDFVNTPGQQFVTILDSDVGFYTDPDCGTWQRI